MSRTNFDEYLKTFFEVELSFIADPTLQRKSWENAQGEKFGECLMITYQSWSVIQENRNKFKLTDLQYMQTQKLFDMIETFQATINYPTTPSEYSALLNNSEWKNIQRYALETYNCIYPKLA